MVSWIKVKLGTYNVFAILRCTLLFSVEIKGRIGVRGGGAKHCLSLTLFNVHSNSTG